MEPLSKSRSLYKQVMAGISLDVSDLTDIICLLTDEYDMMEGAKLQRQLEDGKYSVDVILLSLAVVSQATRKCQWTVEAVSFLGNPMNLNSLVCLFYLYGSFVGFY